MELAERGFEVTVYERQHWGGKVRSTEVPNTGVGGRQNLPLEHGFHFFPTFYRHLPATMSRIPTSRGRSVADNLVPGSRELITRATAPPIVMPSRLPRTVGEWRTMISSLFQLGAGVPEREIRFFMSRMLQFMAMCPERRDAQLDRISWWDFTGAQDRSREYQKLIGRIPSQLLLAVPAQRVSARTIGHAFMGMVESGLTPGGNIDRNLNAPPCQSWVGPWVRWLGKRVKLVLGATLEGFEVDHRGCEVAAATVRVDGFRTRVVADSYVCALPVEVARRMWTPALFELDPGLRRLFALELTWMCGVQLFLSKPRPIEHGHVAHSDTAWALTSVSQAQFWQDFVFAAHGDGRVRDLVSVIIGDWDTPGTECIYKYARDCSEEELVRELVAQLQASLARAGMPIIAPGDITGWATDPDLSFPMPHAGPTNAEPLFMSTVGSWSKRPQATTAVRNLFLAGDYVRTQIDFASAEGANESGRLAANAVLAAHRYQGMGVPLWARGEPRALAPARALDRRRFASGRPCLGPSLPAPSVDDRRRQVAGERLAQLTAQRPKRVIERLYQQQHPLFEQPPSARR